MQSIKFLKFQEAPPLLLLWLGIQELKSQLPFALSRHVLRNVGIHDMRSPTNSCNSWCWICLGLRQSCRRWHRRLHSNQAPHTISIRCTWPFHGSLPLLCTPSSFGTLLHMHGSMDEDAVSYHYSNPTESENYFNMSQKQVVMHYSCPHRQIIISYDGLL